MGSPPGKLEDLIKNYPVPAMTRGKTEMNVLATKTPTMIPKVKRHPNNHWGDKLEKPTGNFRRRGNDSLSSVSGISRRYQPPGHFQAPRGQGGETMSQLSAGEPYVMERLLEDDTPEV